MEIRTLDIQQDMIYILLQEILHKLQVLSCPITGSILSLHTTKFAPNQWETSLQNNAVSSLAGHKPRINRE